MERKAMSAGKGRLGRLYPELTARERALLVLEAWKRGREEDPRVRKTMPDEQAPEFNRYIKLMNAVNGPLAQYILTLDAVASQLAIKHGWLLTLELWAGDVLNLVAYVFLRTKEPITESEHRRLVQRERSRMATVKELAEVLADKYGGWTKADMEPSADGEPLVSDEAWDRVMAEKKAEITSLIEEGELEGERKGRRLLVNTGSFYDWLGEPAPAYPKAATAFEILPDGKAREVRRLREERREILEVIRGAPPTAGLELLRRRLDPSRKRRGKETPPGERMMGVLCETLREGVPGCWQFLRAVESVLDGVADDFGDDPLLPDVRSVLDGTRRQLQSVHEGVQGYTGAFELPEPGEDELGKLKGFLDRAVQD